jgi:hypothetical protein
VAILTTRTLAKILPSAPKIELVYEALDVINTNTRTAGKRAKWTVVVELLRDGGLKVENEKSLEEMRRRYRRSP